MGNDVLRPLRRIHGRVHEEYRRTIKNFKYWKYLKFPLGKKALIIGVPEYANLGDSAIAIAQELFVQQCGLNYNYIKAVSRQEYYKYHKQLIKCVNKKTLITDIGGGNMGNQWFAEEKRRWGVIADFRQHSVTVFPQTIYYTPTEDGQKKQQESIAVYNNPNITIVARERTSYGIMRELYPKANILLTPDIVLSTTMSDYGATKQDRKGVLFCTRDDLEKTVDNSVWDSLKKELTNSDIVFSQTDMYSACPVNKENRKECVRQKMQEFCGAEMVITDRLHGMIFAAITATPCIVFSNYNHKVEGTYEWIKYLSYIRYVTTLEEAKKAMPELLAMKNCKFDNSQLKAHFDKLKEVIKRNA